MFRIAFFVEDKHLAKALIAVEGIALNLEHQVVKNAKPVKEGGKTKVREKGEDPTSLKGKLSEWLLKEKLGSRVTTKDMVEKYSSFGGDGNSVNTGMIKSFLDDGILKRISRGQYQVRE